MDGDKTRSYNTLNTLYHETRQEIHTLNEQISNRDGVIAELRARLGRYERICVGVDGEEPVLVGPSGSLLESLCREICKARHQSDEWEMKAEKSQQEVQQLHVQLRDKELELESVHRQPDHAKDWEIQRLRSALEERGRIEATRAVLCSSLAEEAERLRGQLGTTVKTCQELLARLEGEKEEEVGGGGREEILPTQKDKETTETWNINARLQEENRHLKQRVAYVETLNSKWQKYDSSREEYVRSLCQRLSGSDARTTPGSSAGLGGGAGSASAGSRMLRQEIARLNGLLEEKMKECTRLGRESQERRQDQERIQTLEQQVLIYTEDFKSERADRERAQGRIQDLKLEIRTLQQQHNKQGSREREPREAEPACHAHTRRANSGDRLLRTAPDPPKHAAGPPPLNPARNQPAGLSELQCPRCLTTFNDRDAVQYLNHCEECAEF